MRLSRLLSALRLDLTLTLRNKAVVYTLLAPVLAGFAFQLMFALLTRASLTLVVPDSLPAVVRTELAGVGALIEAGTLEEVHALVGREDDAVGVELEKGRLVALVFGDEPRPVIELAQAALTRAQAALDGHPLPPLEVERYTGTGSVLQKWRTAGLAGLSLLGLFIGVLAVAFGLMEDKLQRTLAAMQVSPLSLGEYLLAKSLTAVVLVFVTTLGALAFAGATPDWTQAALSALGAVPVTVAIGLLLGLVARSDVQLISYVKLLSLILGAPLVAVLLPAAWHPALWWMPTYWVGQGVVGALQHGPWTAALLNSGVSLVFGLGLLMTVRRVMVRTLA